MPVNKSARDVVFTRVSSELTDKFALEMLTGTYQSNGKLMDIELVQNERLIIRVPGQAGIELLPRKPTEFGLKNFFGYRVQFNVDQRGVATDALVKEPNGSNTLRRKK